MIRSGMVSYHADLEPLMRDIDSVQTHPSNYNNGDVETVMDSIINSGMYRPIYVQESTGFIIAGNHTWLACKELGAATVPVVMLDVDDATALRIMIDDNEIARKSRPDTGQLVALLDTLAGMDVVMPSGLTPQDIEQLRALNEIELDQSEHRTWPTLSFQVPPHVRRKFYELTEMAGGENERFILLMKLAGWDGRK